MPGKAARARYLEKRRSPLARIQRKRKAEKRRRKRRKLELARVLWSQFPDCFVLDGPRVPLAIGISDDLEFRRPDLTRKQIESAVRLYVNDLALYRGSFRYGEERIDLDGKPTAALNPSEVEHAGKLLIDAGFIEEAAILARSLQLITADCAA